MQETPSAPTAVEQTIWHIDSREELNDIRNGLHDELRGLGYSPIQHTQTIVAYIKDLDTDTKDSPVLIQQTEGQVDQDEDDVAETPCIILKITLNRFGDDRHELIHAAVQDFLEDTEPNIDEDGSASYILLTTEPSQKFCSDGLRGLLEEFKMGHLLDE